MGSGERKRCSNMAPVRRLRSLAWMKARRLPGVRCSTLNTECRSLLCLMIMPGRNCVAGIAMQKTLLTKLVKCAGSRGNAQQTLYFIRSLLAEVGGHSCLFRLNRLLWGRGRADFRSHAERRRRILRGMFDPKHLHPRRFLGRAALECSRSCGSLLL